MSICIDCIHGNVCRNAYTLIVEPPNVCGCFRNKADYVEVVRCEKCKHGEVSIISRTTDGKERIACYCNFKNGVTDLNSYCPSGERGDTDA